MNTIPTFLNTINRLLVFMLLCIAFNGAKAQDTLNLNELISSSKGKFVKVKYKSELTGSKQIIQLKTGRWYYYGQEGNTLKTVDYQADKKDRASYIDGNVVYYDLDGTEFLVLKYSRNYSTSSKAFNTGVIIEGIRMIQITKQLGAFTISEFIIKNGIPTSKNALKNSDPYNLEKYALFEKDRADSNLLIPPSFHVLHSLNHITNPSLENHPGIKYSFNGISNKIPGWSEGSPSPDFHLILDAATGDACLGFRPFSYINDIEYVTNNLFQPLKKDSLYCFSMRVKLAPYCGYATNQLGVYFNKNQGIYTKERKLVNPNLIFDKSLLMYKTTWMNLQCVYQAKGGEEFASIGSFKPLEDVLLKPVKGIKDEAYYFLDDVTLVPINAPEECPCTVPKDEKQQIGEISEFIAGQRFVLNGVFFENDQAILLPESVDTLNKLVRILRDNPRMIIEISGHTSLVGGYQHNMDLSHRRAEAVKLFLVDAGINAVRLQTKGFGPTFPIASNETTEGQSLNRRVEIKIIKL